MPQTKFDKQLGALQRLHRDLAATERFDPYQSAAMRDYSHHLLDSSRERDRREWTAFYAKKKVEDIERKKKQIRDLQAVIGEQGVSGAGLPWLEQ